MYLSRTGRTGVFDGLAGPLDARAGDCRVASTHKAPSTVRGQRGFIVKRSPWFDVACLLAPYILRGPARA